MPLIENVYCVAVTFKMTDGSASHFKFKFEHSSTETIQLIQKATAMGNW